MFSSLLPVIDHRPINRFRYSAVLLLLLVSLLLSQENVMFWILLLLRWSVVIRPVFSFAFIQGNQFSVAWHPRLEWLYLRWWHAIHFSSMGFPRNLFFFSTVQLFISSRYKLTRQRIIPPESRPGLSQGLVQFLATFHHSCIVGILVTYPGKTKMFNNY